ncbi:MAG: hypothetical protein IIU55_08410 [Paludibacteraceae bacterium]|nr:hypothetical protein [Paludibacteraceae bacterium]
MNIREMIWRYFLHRQPKRKVVMRAWDAIHTIAIIYDCGDEASILQQLSTEHKHIDFFTQPNKEDIFWLSQRPSKQIVNHIRDYHYDLLIDLTQQPTLTMHYMALYTRSDFKVGRHSREGIYDLTINTPAQPSPYYLLEQIMHYINMFTTKQK